MSSSMIPALHPASACRALRSWTGAQRERVATAVQRVLAAWEQDWGLQQVLAAQQPVGCAMACEWGDPGAAAAVRWQAVSLTGSVGPATELWWELAAAAPAVAPRPLDALLRAMFGSPSDPLNAGGAAGAVAEVAVDTAKAAWIDLWQRVGQAFLVAGDGSTQGGKLPPSRPAPHCFDQWSGAVVLTLHWCGQDLRLLAGGNEVENLLRDQLAIAPPSAATPAPLVPLWAAVSGLAAVVRAELEPVELSLGAVRALRVGDVIGLSHPLDRPVLARTAGGDLLCEAYLGKSGDQRAIELLRTPARPF
jgi:Type III flagellar switch regulator (C-ring) FliN C-term